ncbi:MAG: carboxypeptidase regulatory-like domain-containing protein [Candidatus Solibacter usitatus]|nr:carboxypeptidase regulatory-like domain-containing protein [Candidatus Solibacter usitatus]
MSNVLIFFLLASCAWSQEFRATVTGRVSDPSGAPISGAVVTVKNTGTNSASVARTDTQGNYTVPFLQLGSYEVGVEAPGFRKALRTNVELNVNQNLTLSFRLELGGVTQEVTVTSEAPILEDATADRGGVIDAEAIREYPLNGRNPFMLAMLAPGVDFNGSLAYQRPFDNGAIAEWGINGSNRNTEFLMDGAPNNAQAGGNNLAYVPPVDSVREFKIQTNSYDAQYGRSGGGSVNVVLKSGENPFHGAVYEYMRRNWLDANSFQNNARGASKDGHYLDQYGVQLDGPVYFPKLYNGRNKTFFLFNYEGYREGSPQPLILSVPEPEMRGGDFSKLFDARGRKITVYDPISGRNVNSVWTRDPFPDNIIPKDRIHPIASKIASYFPAPNTKTAGADYAQSNYFVSGGVNPAQDRFYNLVFKFDQNFGARNRVFFRHASNDRTELRGTNGVRGPGEDGQFPLKRINDAYVFDWVTTISPSAIFNLRGSFTRYIEGSRSDANRNFDMTQLGFPSALANSLGANFGFGIYRLDNYIALGRGFSNNVTNSATLHPTFTKINGSRTIKAGFDVRWIQYSTQNSGDVFRLNSSTAFTQQTYNRSDALSGNSLASWLLGTPISGTANYPVFPIFFYRYMSPYIQHDWKITKRLTVNSGFRVDFNFPPNERYNRMNRGFDAEVLSPVNTLIDRQAFPDFPIMHGGLRFAGVDGQPRQAANLDWKTWQPRIGFAYALGSRTVIRGGWGRYFMNPNNDFQQTYGFSNSTSLTASTDSNRTGTPSKIADPFPVVLKPDGSSKGLLTYAGRGFNFVNADFRIPHIDQFSFGIQRAVGNRAKFEITYAGSRGNTLQTTKGFNEVDDGTFRDRCNFMLGGNPSFCDAGILNPFRNVEVFNGTTFYTATSQARSQLLRPFPQFAAFSELMRNDGASWYNSVQSLFTWRSRRGMNLNVNYTYSKNMVRSGFLDQVRDVMQQGVSSLDKPHRFTASMINQLPFGRGRRFFNTNNRLVGRIAGGWQNTIIFSISSGRPWGLPQNIIRLKDAKLPYDWTGQKIQAVKPCVLRWNENNTITMQPFSVDYGCTEAYWLEVPRFNPRYEPDYDSHVRLQPVAMADVSLNKTTRVTEKVSLQFRAECFNVANSFFIVSQQFNNNVENVQFGSLIKAAVSAPSSNYPRQMQLGLKLIW